MKFSENWLRQFVDPAIDTRALVDQLTMAGLEVAGFEPAAGESSGVVVGEIISSTAHPNANKLVVCMVNGGDKTFQVVCGASNARPGIKAPFAMPGAKLADLKVGKAKLRGIESFGILCSERELGISDNHEGLMELPLDAEAGLDVRDYLKLDDHIIDLDLTPNRSDCLSIAGLGRETGLLNGLDVNGPEINPVEPSIDDVFEVKLDAEAACPRFVGRIIRAIDITAKTPLWMKEKLRRSEIRSINPVVDITNYIMLELGQPLHAYDLNRLRGSIRVRQSAAGETLTLLGAQDVKLNPGTLLITDQTGPIGIAGIMGGQSTAVHKTTTDIFLESAFFAPTAIAGRARSYGLSSDASHRFERGVDWQKQSQAIERATALLLEIAGGKAGPTTETLLEDGLPKVNEVRLRLDRIERLLGVEIAPTQIDDMLNRLAFDSTREQLTVSGQPAWRVSVPSHRFDIEIEADLIEEIGRIYGYNNLPVRTPSLRMNMAPINESVLPEQMIRRQLASRGYQEIITYSFVDPWIQAILDPEEAPLALSNPISNEMGVMRTTLWAGLVKTLMHNLNRQQSRVRLFEIGLIFKQVPNRLPTGIDDVIQEKTIAGIATGLKQAENWNSASDALDFYDIKGDIETLLALTGQPEIFNFVSSRHLALHPGQTARITSNATPVGYLGLLHPAAMQKLNIAQDVYVFELRLAAIAEGRLPEAVILSKYPEVRRDIAIIIAESIPAAEIKACIRAYAGTCLRTLKLFDVYRGKTIAADRKSLAMGLIFQHVSRTLTEDEINKIVHRIVAALAAKFGARLR